MLEKESQAVSPSCNHDPDREGTFETILVVKYNKRRVKKINFFYLIAKVQYEQKEFSETNLVALNVMFEDLLLRSSKGRDNKFRRLNYTLLRLKRFMSSLNKLFREGNNIRKSLHSWPEDCISDLFSANKYFGLKNGEYKNRNEPIALWKQVKLSKIFQRYIGVGYKDKGSSRDKSIDGSPSLSEICRDIRFQKMSDSINYSIDDPPELFPREIIDGYTVV